MENAPDRVWRLVRSSLAIALFSVIALMLSVGPASAAWKNTPSGAKSTGKSDSLSVLSPSGSCAKSGSNNAFTISWTAQSWVTYTLKVSTNSGAYSSVTTGTGISHGTYTVAQVASTSYSFVVSSSAGASWTIADTAAISDRTNNGGNCVNASF